MKRIILSLFFLLSTFGFGQGIYGGPLNAPPIDPTGCVPSSQGQTGICFASDGVHISIAGGAFGPPLGPFPQGPPGANGINGAQGPQGIPGVGLSVGTKINYIKTETCGGSNGTIKSGYTNTCTGTLTITSIQ